MNLKQSIKRRIGIAQDFSTRGKVIFIVSLFVLISMLLAGMIYLQGNVFDGVRSYVRGEGLWAKAQKDAVRYLERYSYTRDEAAYQAFQSAILVNIGDKNARLALSGTPPDKSAAAKGFLQGQNHPGDVDSMIWFFLHFQRISYMQEAIEVWQRADEKIEELIWVASEIRYEINTGASRPQQMKMLQQRLQKLDRELFDLENRFSLVLGEGARWVKVTAWRVSLALLAIFMGIGIFVSRQIVRGIARSERALIASESRFRSLKESNTIGIVSWRMDGSIDEANDCFLEMLGYAHPDLNDGRLNWRELTPVELWARDGQAVDDLLAEGRCEPYEKALMHRLGHPVPVYVGASLLNGDREIGIAFVVDLTERKKSEEQMRLAATVFAASTDGILITDASMRIVSVNQALCNMTGYDEQELQGKHPGMLQSGPTTPEQTRDVWDSRLGSGSWRGEMVDRKKSGALLPLDISICGVRNGAGEVTHYVATLTDITERKATEEYLRHIAQHDILTGLPNRVLLSDRVEQALKHAERNKSRFAVLFLDLDEFKPVNDRFGHAVGDKLLQIVAGRLTSNVRGTDTVTRLGGDEFVILLHEISDREMVDKILGKTVESVCAPCQIDGHHIHIGVSAGVAIYPDDGGDAESLILHADEAMYGMKKNEHKNR
ncbi:cyclic di-GMP phosphodiesterase Gmr [mine drainage metagenome]|uniref:Cyclic di-GMP phosphodiesterase Gmr n=1 Tax=mine drainage metagenome TaxID=410659 RepID=A0A1J5QX30_9ZZZZ